ncbi:MAG: hypothetical protein ACXU9H_09075, partial [Candidatus Binataceae bacterium]
MRASVPIFALAVLATFLGTGCAEPLTCRPPGVAPLAERSLVYTGYWKTAYSPAANAAYVADLRELGANVASVLVTCYVGSAAAAEVDCSSERTPRSEDVFS